mmetsp:Transcript_30835/g.56107  ORF Transcript_30835/g.56107 Transcript_30835/m.56107 type:complete len:336 (-) Transcript_30835:94-1101(-)
MGRCHDGLQLADVPTVFGNELGAGIRVNRLERLVAAGLDVVEGGLVRGNHAVLASRLNNHVTDGHALVHVHLFDGGADELHGLVGGTGHTDLADDLEDQILGLKVVGHFAIHGEAHGGRDFDKQLSGAENETGIGVADAGGELTKGTCIAGVGVSAKEDFTGLAVTFLGHRNVAHTLVVGVGTEVGAINDVVKVLDIVLLGHVSHNVHITVSAGIGSKNVVVRNNDNTFIIPNLSIRAELLLENTEGPRAAYVMGQKLVNASPNVIARGDDAIVRVVGKNLLGHSHRPLNRLGNEGFLRRCKGDHISSLALKGSRASLGAERQRCSHCWLKKEIN